MRKRLVIIASLLVAALFGCSQLHTMVKPVNFEIVSPRPSGVTARLSAAELQSQLANGASRSAVLLPFADYSPYDSPAKHLEIHGILQKALAAELRAAGMATVSAGDDVTRSLMELDVIEDAAPILKAGSPRTASLLYEFEDGGWSAPMKEKIGRSIHENLIAIQSLGEIVETRALEASTIRIIGEAFSASYVVRGRITVYQSGVKWSKFRHPETNLAFHFPAPGSEIPLMGVADLQAFETFPGAPAGPPPATVRSEDNQPFEKHSLKITPIVRLDLFIQDALTGDVVFVNACEVRSSELYTISSHGTSRPYELTDRAVKKGVEDLLRPLIR